MFRPTTTKPAMEPKKHAAPPKQSDLMRDHKHQATAAVASASATMGPAAGVSSITATAADNGYLDESDYNPPSPAKYAHHYATHRPPVSEAMAQTYHSAFWHCAAHLTGPLRTVPKTTYSPVVGAECRESRTLASREPSRDSFLADCVRYLPEDGVPDQKWRELYAANKPCKFHFPCSGINWQSRLRSKELCFEFSATNDAKHVMGIEDMFVRMPPEELRSALFECRGITDCAHFVIPLRIRLLSYSCKGINVPCRIQLGTRAARLPLEVPWFTTAMATLASVPNLPVVSRGSIVDVENWFPETNIHASRSIHSMLGAGKDTTVDGYAALIHPTGDTPSSKHVHLKSPPLLYAAGGEYINANILDMLRSLSPRTNGGQGWRYFAHTYESLPGYVTVAQPDDKNWCPNIVSWIHSHHVMVAERGFNASKLELSTHHVKEGSSTKRHWKVSPGELIKELSAALEKAEADHLIMNISDGMTLSVIPHSFVEDVRFTADVRVRVVLKFDYVVCDA